MTLKDFMQVCSPEDYIGIWDIDTPSTKKNKSKKRFEEQPSKQNYFKITNIPYGRIMYFLDKDIFHINHTEKGYLVRLYTKGKAKNHMDRYELARMIAAEIKRL